MLNLYLHETADKSKRQQDGSFLDVYWMTTDSRHLGNYVTIS